MGSALAGPDLPRTDRRPDIAPGITAASLVAAPPGMQKQMLGQALHLEVAALYPELAEDITGMMLDLDNSVLLNLVEAPGHLKAKIGAVVNVLRSGKAKPAAVFAAVSDRESEVSGGAASS